MWIRSNGDDDDDAHADEDHDDDQCDEVLSYQPFLSKHLDSRRVVSRSVSMIWMINTTIKMMSHQIGISFQGIEVTRWRGVGQVEASLVAPLVHVQDQLRGWFSKKSYMQNQIHVQD